MILGYATRNTWLHRMSAGPKLAALAILGIATIGAQDWRWLSIGLGCVVTIYLSLGRQVFGRLVLFKPIIPFLLAIGLIQGWTGTWSEAAISIVRMLLMISM